MGRNIIIEYCYIIYTFRPFRHLKWDKTTKNITYYKNITRKIEIRKNKIPISYKINKDKTN